MATGAIALTSLGGVARWIDETVTDMLTSTVAPMVASATEAILPLVSVGLTISLVWYGWLIATRAIQVPVMSALRRVVNIVIVVNIAGAGGLYQTQIVSTMMGLPTAMVSVFTQDPTTPADLLDEAANTGAEVSTRINDRAPNSVTNPARGIGFFLVALIVTILSAVITAIGIIALTAVKVGMAVCVVLGPLVILALLFEHFKDYFKLWLSQVFFYTLYGAVFLIVFGIILGMFGTLQQGLLQTTQAPQMNIFSMLAAIVIFIAASKTILDQVSIVVGKITGGGGGGVNVPFLGKLG